MARGLWTVDCGLKNNEIRSPPASLVISAVPAAVAAFFLVVLAAPPAVSHAIHSGAVAAGLDRGHLARANENTIGVRVGRCRVDGRLSIEDKCVADRQAELQLPFSLRLGSGLSLVTGRDAASPQSPRWGGRK